MRVRKAAFCYIIKYQKKLKFAGSSTPEAVNKQQETG